MDSTENNNNETKLYAGKFKTVEELETGYKNSLPVFQENTELKKKVEEFSKIPDDYSVPDEINLHDADITEAKRLAKESGLTQSQYEKFLKQQQLKALKQTEDFESAKKEIGSDKLNLLQDYVNKFYPEKLREFALKQFIKNKELRENAFQHRDQLLNNRMPGMGSTFEGQDKSISYDDLLAAREAHQKNKADPKLREKYLDVTRQYAEQKERDKAS